MAKSIRETICNNGGFNCKAVLDLELSHNVEGMPIYIYKCNVCGLEERGVKANKEIKHNNTPNPNRPMWRTTEKID
jgi:hypothetical protein